MSGPPDPHTYEPEDLLREARIDSIDLSPDGALAACAVTTLNAEQDRYDSTLWWFPLDGAPARRLTDGLDHDDQPRWSPDGRQLAFLSDRSGGSPQIHLLPRDGGEARVLTRLKGGVTDFRWSPRGDALLALSAVAVDPDRHEADDAFAAAESSRAPDAPEVAWRLPYKLDGSGYTLGQRTQLFLVPLDSGEARVLTSGDSEVRSASWSPDGSQICFARTRAEATQAHCTDVWTLRVAEDPPAPRRLSHEQHSATTPSWSPDGRHIAFSGAIDEGDAQLRLWLVDLADGAERATVRGLGDESIEVVASDLQWNAEGSELLFVRALRGTQQAAAIELRSGDLHCRAAGLRHLGNLAVVRDGRLVFTAESADAPLELYIAEADGSGERRLSHFNAWRDERTPLRLELRRFEVPNGEGEGDDGNGGTEAIEGWLLRARDAPAGPMPLLVDVHGGPASYAFLSYPQHPYWQTLCSRGWAVLALNPVGSSSYGRPFSERLRARWGELDLPQHLAAIDALEREGIADGRCAITGSSYGGYLSAWAIGQSRRFRAAVVCAPVGNLETHYGTSDSGFYADPYSMEGKPALNRELCIRLSPVVHLEKARTPTLFLQGKEDEHCPKCQAEEMFVTLRRAAKAPTEMVLYPGGSHHVYGQGRPSHRVDIQRRLTNWLTRWIDKPLPED